CGASKIAANAARRDGAEADQILRAHYPNVRPAEGGVDNITIGYGDPFFHRPAADQLNAGEFMSEEAVDAHIHKLLNTGEGQQALRELGRSSGMREIVSRMKADWAEVMPGKPFKMWSDVPHENSAADSLEKFFRKELGEDFGSDIPMKVWTDEQKKVFTALRTEPVFPRLPLEKK
ncbi:MAG: hypothetical protein K2X81_11525, partial [Candidatus Obscuribacterales bacterium]|nr:hypothetical protein [Candidatus Obscuribacterales bacterium]